MGVHFDSTFGPYKQHTTTISCWLGKLPGTMEEYNMHMGVRSIMAGELIHLMRTNLP